MNCPKCSNPLHETGDGYLVCSACGAYFKKKVQEQIIPLTEADERARELEQLNSRISELEQKQRELEQNVKNRPQQVVVGGAVRPGESKFTASVFELFIQKLFLAWMTLVSCGIAYPWLKCQYERFVAEHTYINGKQQRFDGKGGELAAKYLLWLFLSAITFGIYSIWLGNNVRKWVASHTHFEGENGESSYDGSAIKMWAYNWLARLAKACTLNLATPWVTCMQERYIAKHTVIDDHQLEFNGTGGGLFKKNVLWVVLTIATCGVFTIWLSLKQEQWRCSNVAIEGFEGMSDFGTSAAPLSEEERQARAEAKRRADEAAKAKRAQEKQAQKELRRERRNTPGYKAATALFTIAVLALVGGIICMALCYSFDALDYDYTAIVVCATLFSIGALSLFAGSIASSKKSKRKALAIAAIVLIVCSVAGLSGGIYGIAGIAKEKNDPFFYEYDYYYGYSEFSNDTCIVSTDPDWYDGSVVDAKLALQKSLTRYDIPSYHDGYPVTRIKSLATTTWEDDEGNTVHGNDTLEYLYIPYTVTSIDSYALANLPKLSYIEVESDNPVYYSQNGILFRKDSDYQTLQIEHIPQSLTGSITLPDELRYIPDRAFRNLEDVTSVVIPDGIASIGSSAFAGCSNLTQVTIPSSVIQIESGAFARCTSLESITLPDSIKTIGYGAFYGCTALNNVTIPSSVTTIDDNAFEGCSALTSITIPENVEHIDDDAFKNCTSLTHVNWNATNCILGDSIYSYNNEAHTIFDGCSNLSSVSIGKKVTSIPNYLFADRTALTNVSFASNSKLTTIGKYAFRNCSALNSISIPSGVTHIGDQAFANCSTLNTVSLPRSITTIEDQAFANCSALSKISIPSGVTSIDSQAFANCIALTDITIPSDLTYMASDAFYGCSGLTQVTWNAESYSSYGSYAFFESCNNLKTIIIGSNVTQLPKAVFKNCTSVTDVTINSTTSSLLSNNSFSGCTNISKITAATATIAGNVAKQANPTSFEVIILNGCTSIEADTFSYCTGLTGITIPNSVTSIKKNAFDGCTRLTEITIPNGVTSIGQYAFNGCSHLSSITIPNSVTSINSNAFNGCNNLSKVYITSLKKWCAINFYNYESNPLYYAHSLYLNNTIVRNLVVPNGTTGIGRYAFYNCSSLTSVTIPDSVTSIGSSAFSGCSGLTSVTIGNSVTSIYNSAFSGCAKLTEITIPDSVTSIGDYAFYGCSGLTSITIPDSVTSIGSSALSGCSALESVTIPFVGAKAGITSSDTYQYPFGYIFGDSSYIGSTATEQYFYSDSTSSTSNRTYYIPSSLKSVTVTGGNILYGAFYNCSGMTNITIPDGVTSISECAFYNCSGLTSITIPDSVTHIGTDAFYECNNISKVYITDLAKWCAIDFGNASANPLYYANKLYLDNSLVTDLVIPDSVTSIGAYAFYNCTSLASISIPDSVTYIGSDAFYGCTGIERTFSFVSNGGTTCSDITGVYISSLPTPTKSGYALEGWYDNADLEGDAVSAPYFGASDTLYAKWALATGESFSTAKTATTGTTYTVNLTTSVTNVYYKFVPTSTRSYTIQSTRTGSIDPCVYLYNSSHEQKGYDDDGTGGRDFQLTYTMTAGYTYYIRVTSYNGSGTGTYTFTIS